MKTKTFFSELTPPRHGGLLARFFALFFCLAMGVNVWGALPLTTMPKGTTNFAGTDGLSWTTTTKNIVLYDDANMVMLWSNGNNITAEGTTLKIGNSSKASAFVFYVSSECNISVSLARNGSDITAGLYYLGASTTALTDPNASGAPASGLCESGSLTSTESTLTLSKTNAAAGYYEVFGSLRFTAKSITIADPSGSAPTCSATAPGDITKGAKGNPLTLTAAGSPVANNTWYWQTAEDGTSTANSGATFDVTAAGTYYVRSYCSDVDGCWSTAKSIEVTDADLSTSVSCPEKGERFKVIFSAIHDYSLNTTKTAEEEITSSYATVTNGKAYAGTNKNSDQTVSIKNQSSSMQFCWGSSNTYLKLELDCPLANGDVISFESTTNYELSFGLNTTRVTSPATSSKTYTVTEGDGLKNQDVIYVWRAAGSTTYVHSITIRRPVFHSINYAETKGADMSSYPTQYEEGVGVASFADLADVTGWDFAGWSPASISTTATTDQTITATWTAAATKYTVTYKDGETTLDTEDVEEGQKAANVPTPTKELNTFAGWEDAEHNAIDFATATITGPVTAYAKWTPWGYASSADVATEAAGSKTAIATFLAASNIDSKIGTKGSYDTNGLYTGYKMKNNGDYIIFKLQSGKRVQITMGYVQTSVTITVDGVAQAFTTSTTAETVFTYDAASDVVVKLVNNSADDKTTTLKSITIGDIPAVSDDATLKSLKYNETDIALSTGKFVYYVTLPYGATTPTVSGVANDDNATSVTCYQADFTAEPANMIATVRVVAEDGTTTKDYQVRFTVAPKLGAEIIKATITSNSAATASGLYAGSVATSNSGKKLGSNGNYVKFVLKTDETFATGDVLAFDVTAANGATKIYITNAASANVENLLATIDHTFAEGMNYITLPEAINGLSEFYLYRVDSKFNPTINSVAVLRQMPSMIKSFTIGEAEGVIDQENKTIAVTVPYGTDVTALTPVVEAYANGGATVTPTTAQDFTSAKTYTVTSAYGEDAAVSYEVTVTVAEPACPTAVTISGTATYTDGDAIELTAATDGTGEVTYQWYKDEVAIVGATSATFSKTATMTDGGNYVCKANQGTCEEVASAAYAVTVNKKPVTAVTIAEAASSPFEIKMGETLTLTAVVTPADATYAANVTWTENASYYSLSGVNPVTISPVTPFSAKSFKATVDGRNASNVTVSAYSEISFANCDPIEAKKCFGSNITLPTPTGGTAPFLGWYTDAEYNTKAGNAGASYKSTSNVTLYAKWTLPDAETPNITTQPIGATYDEGDPIAPLTVVATVSEGTLSYQWYKGSDPIVGATAAEYTPTEDGSYKVVVTNTLADHNPASATSDVAVITINRTYVQTDVTGTVTWDWSKSSIATLQDTYTDQLLAELIPETATFATSNLVISTYGKAYAVRDTKYAQVSKIKFHTTVPGFITVKFSDTGSSSRSDSEEYYRYLYVNGVKTQYYSFGTSAGAHGLFTTGNIFVAEGDVELSFKKQDAATNCNVYIITFTEVSMSTIRTGLTDGKTGTMCRAEKILAVDGAVIYDVEKKNAIGVDLVEAEFPLVAGKPYIYQAEKSELRVVFASDAPASEVAEANGLVGNLSTAGTTIAIEAAQTDGKYTNYVFQNNHICYVATAMELPADRAYLNMAAVQDATVTDPVDAPARRRITMTQEGIQTPTAIDQVEADETVKFFENGNFYILRAGKLYNAQGQLVK